MAPPRPARKRPFDIDEAMDRIRRTIADTGVADAAMFALASEGYTSLFEQLVACIISIRTLDETMLRGARRLFASANAGGNRGVAGAVDRRADQAVGVS
jgi:endonuclease-3